MFSKEIYEFIEGGIKRINKLTLLQDRIDASSELRTKIYDRINDEVDDLFSDLNLRKTKKEEEL